MEASTTTKQMLAGNSVFVPKYQPAYSWDTEFESCKPPKQVNIFLADLEDYNRSSTKSKYYFGHFLFEEIADNKFAVINGHQRLTTIIIFLSALFARLKQIHFLNEPEQEAFEDIIKKRETYHFATVEYDNQLFKDYVIDQIKKNNNGLETESARRLVNAFDFFEHKLSDKDEAYLLKMLETVKGSSCTTHTLTDEFDSIHTISMMKMMEV